MNSILFLDIDGVIVLHSENTDKFNSQCVNILNDIIKQTNCEIVISSDWRNQYTLEQLKQIFINNEVIKTPISVTPNSNEYLNNNLDESRVEEILEYVIQNDIINYCAVDDLHLYSLGDNNFVRCKQPNYNGIMEEGVKEQIINNLKIINDIKQ